jgi:hypothetical protein
MELLDSAITVPMLISRLRLFVGIATVVIIATVASGYVISRSQAAGLAGDINNDGAVNVFDLSSLLSAWSTNSTPADLNGDGVVSIFDLSILLSHWGQTATPTPTAGCTSGTPITITTGGTYSGCYESTDANVAAVSVNTTASVILSHATIIHKGIGVETGASARANLTITDSTFTALDPGTPTHQPCLYADAPAALTAEHNQFTGCQGVLVNAENFTTSPFSVSYNNFTDIGRYGQTDWFAGAVHTQNMTAPGATLNWNRITSHYGKSVSEDVFGLVNTNGSSASPIEVAHNLINGAYPYTGDGTNYAGLAIDLADTGGSYQNAHDNTAVNLAGTGFGAGSGTHIHFTNNKVVSDGLADNGARVNVSYADGFSTWHNSTYPPSGPDLYVTGSTAGLLRWNGTSWERADYYLPVCDPAGACTGNTSLGTVDGSAEQAAITAYEQTVTAAQIVIGPR